MFLTSKSSHLFSVSIFPLRAPSAGAFVKRQVLRSDCLSIYETFRHWDGCTMEDLNRLETLLDPSGLLAHGCVANRRTLQSQLQAECCLLFRHKGWITSNSWMKLDVSQNLSMLFLVFMLPPLKLSDLQLTDTHQNPSKTGTVNHQNRVFELWISTLFSCVLQA